jgi:nucleotide-binding universal stress UspA family protein
MYRTILVGYEDRDEARDALALGRQLADMTGAELVVAGVFPGGAGDPDEHVRRIEDAAHSVGAAAEVVSSSSAARGLHDLAEAIGADIVVVGSCHRGVFGRVLAGTVGTELLHGAACAVAVAPRGYRDQMSTAPRAIVVGFDASAEAGRALMAGWELARRAGATLRLVSAAVPPTPSAVHPGIPSHDLHEAICNGLSESLAEARATVPAGVEVQTKLVTGDAVGALTDAARRTEALLVVGSRGHGPVRRVLLGSVSAKLVRRAPCPVIVTPRGAHDAHSTGRPAEVATAP